MEVFALVVGGSFWGLILALWFCWGVYRLEQRGPDAPLGKQGWLALALPPLIATGCLIAAKVELEGQRLALLPVAVPAPTYETGGPHSAGGALPKAD